MRARSTMSVISPTNSFASMIASLTRATLAATSGSRRISSALRPAGAAGAGGFDGGGVCGVSVIALCALVLLARRFHERLQHVERFALARHAERDVFRFAVGDCFRVAFAIPSAGAAVGLRHRGEGLRLQSAA